MKFPHDVPQRKVLKAPGALRFEVVRTGNHIAPQQPGRHNDAAHNAESSARRQEFHGRSSCERMSRVETQSSHPHPGKIL
ncbi:MAG: hypothetical protein ACOX8D_10455 [Methanoculleus sp.]